MKYSTIIFDLDGTLVDSKINFSAIYKNLNLAPDRSIIEYVNTLQGADRQSALDIVHYYEEEGALLSKPIPAVLELIEELLKKKFNLGVFTLNSRSIALKTLEIHQLKIPLLIAREDARPKPDAEGLLKICHHYSTPLHQALYVGDYKYDLMAGKNANIRTALYAAKTPDFKTDDAYFQFTHFNELKKYLLENET